VLRFIKNLQNRPQEERAFVAFSLTVIFVFFTILLWIATFRSEPEVPVLEADAVDTSAYVEEHTTSVDLSPFYILKKEFSSLVELMGQEVSKFLEKEEKEKSE